MNAGKMHVTNSNFLTLDSSNVAIKVIKSSAYLFIVEKMPDGSYGARHPLADYEEGGVTFNFTVEDSAENPGKFEIVLAGTTETEVEIIPFDKALSDYINELKQSWKVLCRTFKLEEAPELSKETYPQVISILAQKSQELFKADKEFERTSSVEYQRLSDRAYQNTLSTISAVVTRKKDVENVFNSDEVAVQKVFRMVAKKTRIEVKENEKHYPNTKAGIQAIAKDNTVRLREVLLRDKWYHDDCGHLIAFYRIDGNIELSDSNDIDENYRPVALIKKKDSYMMYDPADNSVTKITAENSSRINPMAFMLYRTITKDKITIKDLCFFTFADIKVDFVRFVIIGLLCTLIGMLTPMMTKNFIDYVIPNAARTMAVQICFLVFVCNMASLLGSIAKSLANMRLQTKSQNVLQTAIIDRLLRLPVNFFKNYTSGDLSDRAMTISQIQQTISGIILSAVMNLLFSIVYLVQEFNYCAYFAKLGLLFLLVPVLVPFIACFATYHWEKALIESGGKITGMLFQFLSGIEKIRNSNSERRVFSEWSREYTRQRTFGYNIEAVNNVMQTINAVYPTLVSILFYFFFSVAMKEKKIASLSTGTFMAFLSAYGSFQGAVLAFTGSILSIRNLIPMSKRVKSILDETPEIQDNKPSIGKLEGSIEINHLNFRYEEKGPLILDDVNMKIEAGEYIGIVGTSGAGKSTLLRMILGFEKPESGAIYFDRQDMNDFDVGSIRRQMGVVLQNDTVLQGTMLQNIVGSSGLKEADAWAAAKAVALDKDIREMPMGMFTMIPAGGLSISGGQLQRLIIARAIIRKPNILLFDEATSALDNVTQAVVRQSLDELKVTRIVIAHRLSTIIHADRIYVMKNGKVIETGNYEELIKMNGYFAELAKRQNV